MENEVPKLREFTFCQIGELYTPIIANSQEDAEEILESLSRADINRISYFKGRDSYWL